MTSRDRRKMTKMTSYVSDEKMSIISMIGTLQRNYIDLYDENMTDKIMSAIHYYIKVTTRLGNVMKPNLPGKVMDFLRSQEKI